MTVNNEKIAIVIKSDLKDWQKLNVVAFLSSSIAIQFPHTHGKEFTTASQSKYLPFIKNPILIYKAEEDSSLKRAFLRARDRKLNIGIYTKELFETMNEEDNLAEILKHEDDQLNLIGMIVYGDSKNVSKALDGLKFHS